MGSARDLLHEDEELLVEARPHVVTVAVPVLVLVVAASGAVTIALRDPGAPVVVGWLLAAMVVLPALWSGARVLRWRSSRFLVTTSRLLYQRGVLGRDILQLRLQRVAEVHCSQSLGQRLIGTGRLVFEVAGGADPLFVEDVRRPRRLQRVITAQLDRFDTFYDPYDAGGGVSRHASGARGALAPMAGGGSRRGSAGTTRGRSPRERPWTDTPPHGVAIDDEGARSVPGQILQLDELRRRGLLSDDEFAAKKAELLGRL